MPDNANLRKAKLARNDEFYTRLSDIEKEIQYYREHFSDKTVYCNCDNPYESNFVKYFIYHFNDLKLKKLIATNYAREDTPAYKAVVTHVSDEVAKADTIDIEKLADSSEITITQLQGDGDFRSSECTEILKQADIVVTNPPFSLFREYIPQLIEHEKDFIVIGNLNAVTYKVFFPLLKGKKVWTGMSRVHTFDTPTGNKGLVNGLWYTTFKTCKHCENLKLTAHYDSSNYPTYDNFAAIEVSKIVDVPCDYSGAMGVPFTFLDKYNPDQFEIIGADFTLAGKVVVDGKVKPNPQRMYLDGKRLYARILIRNRYPQ